jgi:outer membrane biogenesis lipoprotein LolB
MMRFFLVLAAMLFLFAGCSSKNVRVSGMVCPEGHTEQMVTQDLRECRAYDEKAAEKASRSKLSPECIECLKKRGYEIE